MAQGRTWLGKSALERVLVDKLGGFEAAILLGKQKANLPAGDTVKLVSYDTQKTLLQQLLAQDEEDLAGQALSQALAKAAAATGLRKVLSPAPGLTALARALLARREPVFPMAELRLDIH